MTNKEIIEGFIHNDKKIILRLYNRLFPKIKDWIRSYYGNEDDAKNAIWKAFAIFHQRCQKTELKRDNIEGYIMRIVQYWWYQQIAKRKEDMLSHHLDYRKIEEHIATIESPMEIQLITDKEEAIQQFQNQLKKLSILCQQLILLKYQYGLPHEDIATRYETSIEASRKRLSRCLKELIIVIEKQGLTKELAQYYPGINAYIQKYLMKKK